MKTNKTSRTRHRTLRVWLICFCLLLAPLSSLPAQPAPERGPRQVDPRWHALTNATVVVEPGKRLENATIVVRAGVIVSVEAGGEVPLGARHWDCAGMTIYPGFVEPHLPVELPRPAGQQAHWNSLVMPQRTALDGSGVDAALRKELRSLGFTVAAVVGKDGVFRGSASVVALGAKDGEVADSGAERLATGVYQGAAFERTGGWGGSYPNSKMGSVALFRQTLADADWHRAAQLAYQRAPERSEPPAASPALTALGSGDDALPLLFVVQDEWEALRAGVVAREFGRKMLLLGCGREFRRLDAIAKLGLPVITPLDFPDPPDVKSAEAAETVSLRSLMTWEQSPTQPRRLLAAGVQTAFTTTRLQKRGDFHDKVRSAIAHGLTDEQALDLLTRQPARLLGLEDRIGTIAAGKLANLIVVEGNLFAKDAEIRDVWVSGRRYLINAKERHDHDGRWEISLARTGEQPALEGALVVKGKSVSLEFDKKEGAAKARDVDLRRWGLNFLVDGASIGVASPNVDAVLRFSGVLEGTVLYGTYLSTGGEALGWYARRVDEVADVAIDGDSEKAHRRGKKGKGKRKAAADVAADVSADVPDVVATPLGAFGVTALPSAETVLIKNATVWTGGPDGIIDDGAVLIDDGKIRYVGSASGVPAVSVDRVVDARGKHVTPGIIDCHSHTGMNGGTNEGGERVTAEVRVQDIIDPDDVNWYRQLAGGLTAANQLHGSANAIGGQNSVVKLRWGAATADDMRLDGAPSGIKFALGENPKRVAANTDRSDEYPQTRLGVAALIEDRLLAGRDYHAAWRRYQDLPENERRLAPPPRRDLELEAMAEVVTGKRLIHCHSYRQDEILMLCRVAERMGFKIGTFQHVLEGYKVADAVRDASLGGSTFADWWAYKFEVIDAIPYNAAIMHEVGVCVSINSDSSEHARRLNTEAAKAVKYGGLDPHAALQLVTLNPAKQLGVANRIGSLEVGKDADVVVWSGDPLSYYSRCERTFVDGREYYSLERDRELRANASRERDRLVQKLLARAAKKRPTNVGSGREESRVIGPLGSYDRSEYYDDSDYCDEDHRGSCGCEDLLRAEGK
ncbi:MAG: amidohydrolase family protein [Planctomycetota bacterium]